MQRYYYRNTIASFLANSENEILGQIIRNIEFSTEQSQSESWLIQIRFLKEILIGQVGEICFEYSIPRMGSRIDVVLIIGSVVFVLEFKTGNARFEKNDIDQVWDYALDLKNFHEPSHKCLISPILIARHATSVPFNISGTSHNDNLLFPIKSNFSDLGVIINEVLNFATGNDRIDPNQWFAGRYTPTPTIIEAAKSLYNNHSVKDITRRDSTAVNLHKTTNAISSIIEHAQLDCFKAICFVTGVPGAGKTLVGLDVATKHMDQENKTTSVYLSGNGPLVAILREALTRDKIKRDKEKGKKTRKGEVFEEVKAIVQNIHHFRDEALRDPIKPPFDHVAIFDEAQRAWNNEKLAHFLKRRGLDQFEYNEPEFLIMYLDRHTDWAVIVCLVGGGQEINTGELGISSWIDTIVRRFPNWHVYVSRNLHDSEYAAGQALDLLAKHKHVSYESDLHLEVSMRSFRAEHLSSFVKNLLDLNVNEANQNYNLIKHKYPLVITRDLLSAKNWLKKMARGSERYGIIVSSQAQRLKPFAIDVKAEINPIHWFLEDKNDIRSSFYLEDVATEFDIQGLELDWSCVTWDGDFRHTNSDWKHYSFVGKKWQNINKPERKMYLKNAYRVLLTRARQGMVIVVPSGDRSDPTRRAEYYDGTYEYLRKCGIPELT